MQIAFHMRNLGNQAWRCFRDISTWIKKWLTIFELLFKGLNTNKEESSLVPNQEFRDMCLNILENYQFPCTPDVPIPSIFAEANDIYIFLKRETMEGELNISNDQ
ncbi:hypothetical protein ACER0C_003135 [Sarotherodon galilaeus]